MKKKAKKAKYLAGRYKIRFFSGKAIETSLTIKEVRFAANNMQEMGTVELTYLGEK